MPICRDCENKSACRSAFSEGHRRRAADADRRLLCIPRPRFGQGGTRLEGSDVGRGLPDWRKPEWETVLRIVSDDRFLRLPASFEIHELSIMQDFANSVGSRHIGDELDDALHRSGAFRNFRATLRRHGKHTTPDYTFSQSITIFPELPDRISSNASR